MCTSFLCGRMFLILLGRFLEVDLLGHVVTLRLTFWVIAHTYIFPVSNTLKVLLDWLALFTCSSSTNHHGGQGSVRSWLVSLCPVPNFGAGKEATHLIYKPRGLGVRKGGGPHRKCEEGGTKKGARSKNACHAGFLCVQI